MKNKKYNILIINTLYYPLRVGGAEKSVQFLAESLAARGHAVSVATLGTEQVLTKNIFNNVTVYRLPIANIYHPTQAGTARSAYKFLWHIKDIYNYNMYNYIYKIMQDTLPNIVHTHNIAGFSVAIWAAAKRLGLPLIHTLRDYYLACPKTTMFANGKNCAKPCLQCQMFSAYKRQASKHVDIVTGVSAFVLRRHLKLNYFPYSKIKVIYNPYGQHPIERRGLPTSAGIRFGFIGAINQAKGIERLLAAYAKVRNAPGALLVAGKGTEEYMQHLTIQYPDTSFEFLGFVQPADFFSRINVLVVPSLWHDPAPRVVLEAMSYGVPVIGSNRGGIPELVGDAGWVFDPDHPDELRELMEHLARNPGIVEEYSRRALKHVAAFDADTSVQEYIDVYHSVIR